ncbi:MAG: DUF1499 domain-containing protein [Rhodospirillaceae bacterium]|jgi:uncharacterized protein (DUF1499 family)|nr:DUF1499 domain-containing protein [Rhodospirillaceae bacterium]MBT3491781.1 DUF1499 domain-containing protein [Rhodospirillaceae bacterium]MBT3783163.1 DUF1499 domain-containing protein [Rhodospirillaceae bacterium]MBT3978159.1 DUF1499 domain-containing protein [Rhodospirillaceae bacterium]MBT4167140.1 DUF1499 domain-containing protein [Rhodospirillaceae bacterium]
MNKQLLNSAKAIVALIVLLALLVIVMGREKSLQVVFGAYEVKPVAFANLELTPKSNQFLVCPPGFCAATPHMLSPTFAGPADALQRRWMKMLAAQPRIEHGAADEAALQYDYIQRSGLMNFPDSITVRFIPLTPDSSSLAIYSRSHYGRSDFGVNESRIRAWLGALERP